MALEHDELEAQAAAIRAFMIYQSTIIVAALAEKGAIDPHRVFSMNKVIARGFIRLAKQHADEPKRRRTHELTAEALIEVEMTMRTLAAAVADA